MFTPRISVGIATVARSTIGADADTRAYLLAEAMQLRRQCVESQLDDERWRDYVWRETSKAVDALASGGPYQFHSYQLPPDHPMLAALGPYAWLEIGADDVVRVAK
jgi:hypothetical protein